LESIQLPFILASILFALFIKKINLHHDNVNLIYTIFSGICMGLAIFTKVPAFTFIPIAGLLIYRNSDKKLVNLGLWFIPVILIPCVWPMYSIHVGQFDFWIESIYYQTHRVSKPLIDTIVYVYQNDPLLLILGIGGLAYCVKTIGKNFVILLWIMPYIVLLYSLSYVSSFHLIPIVPVLCISSALLIVEPIVKVVGTDFSNVVYTNRRRIGRQLPFMILAIVGVIGMMISTGLIINSQNSPVFRTIAAVAGILPSDGDQNDEGHTKNNISLSRDSAKQNASNSSNYPVVIASNRYTWVLQYVFSRDHIIYKTPHNWIDDKILADILSGHRKVLLVSDSNLMMMMSKKNLRPTANSELIAETWKLLYQNTTTITTIGGIQVRTNLRLPS